MRSCDFGFRGEAIGLSGQQKRLRVRIKLAVPLPTVRRIEEIAAAIPASEEEVLDLALGFLKIHLEGRE